MYQKGEEVYYKCYQSIIQWMFSDKEIEVALNICGVLGYFLFLLKLRINDDEMITSIRDKALLDLAKNDKNLYNKLLKLTVMVEKDLNQQFMSLKKVEVSERFLQITNYFLDQIGLKNKEIGLDLFKNSTDSIMKAEQIVKN